MLSRLYPLLRCNNVAKVAAPFFSPKVQIYKSSAEANWFIRCKNMSTGSDDDINKPSKHLDYAQLVEKKKDPKTLLIDVREHSEINETGKLPGSIHIPLKEVEKALKDMSPDDFYKAYNVPKPDHDTEIIFSCRSGKRSLSALKTALALGYKNAAHYKKGWLDWAENTKKTKN